MQYLVLSLLLGYYSRIAMTRSRCLDTIQSMIFKITFRYSKDPHGIEDTNEGKRSIVNRFMIFPCFALECKSWSRSSASSRPLKMRLRYRRTCLDLKMEQSKREMGYQDDISRIGKILIRGRVRKHHLLLSRTC